eukprot:182891-Amphidinium_carterae.2
MARTAPSHTKESCANVRPHILQHAMLCYGQTWSCIHAAPHGATCDGLGWAATESTIKELIAWDKLPLDHFGRAATDSTKTE